MILAHRIALDPTAKQANAFARACGVARFAYNWALDEWNRQYAAGAKPDANALKAKWNAIRREQFPWVYDSPKGANAAPFRNLAKAFVAFFKGTAKRPAFHRKGERDSFYVESDQFRVEGRGVVLPRIGRVRMREPLRFEGKIMGTTVSRTAGRWFIAIQVEVADPTLPRTGVGIVGVDLGLKAFATLSTGETIEAPKPLKAAQKRLRRAQRVLARRVKGSKRRAKAKVRVARIHRRVRDIRNDFLHKLSTRLVRENQVVAVEDLAVKNMVKNRKLARAISDAGWSEFFRQVRYKSLRYGTQNPTVDRFYPSSKACSGCGNVKASLSLSERTYRCDECGAVKDREWNAAINIRTAGLAGIARGLESAGPTRKRRVKLRQDEARTMTCANSRLHTR